MNTSTLYNIARFILLLAAQVVIFNHMELSNYLTPYPYVLFIILYPVNGNKSGLLLASFFLGLIVDMFLDSGGVHAAASLTLAYMRPAFFKFSFGVSYEYQTVKINDRLTPERFSFILLSVVTHHLVLFVLEIFSFNLFWNMLLRTIFSTIFTIVLCIIIIYLFKPNKR